MARRVSDTENRLLLMYCLRALEEADDLELLRFVSDGGWMNYIELRLGLAALTDSGEVRTAAGGAYTLTPEGRGALDAFASRIPASRRAEVDGRAVAWRRQLRDERSLPAESYPQPDGRCLLRLSVMDGAEELMRILLMAPSRPDRIELRWQAVGQAVYRAVLQELFAAVTEQPALPGDCALEDLDGQTLLLLGDGEPLRIALTLPEAETARRLASAWPDCRRALPDRIWKAVTNANIF